MRSRARLWAAADFGVRFSYVAISFCSASCIGVLRHSRSVPCGQCVRKKSLGLLHPSHSNRRKKALRPGRGAYRGTLFARDRFLASALKNQFQCELEQSRVSHLLRLAEGRVSRSAVHSVELSVIEDVENLRPEFQTRLFPNCSVFKQPHVPIVDGRVAAESAWSAAKGSQRTVGEIRG